MNHWWQWTTAASVLIATANAIQQTVHWGRRNTHEPTPREAAKLLRGIGCFELAVAASLLTISPFVALSGSLMLALFSVGVFIWAEVKSPSRVGRYIRQRLVHRAQRSQ